MDAKQCVCKGQDFTALLSAWYSRTRSRITDGVMASGKPSWNYRDLRMAVTLIRTLSEYQGQKAPFLGKFLHLDHHLAECPCSPRFVAPKADAEA